MSNLFIFLSALILFAAPIFGSDQLYVWSKNINEKVRQIDVSIDTLFGVEKKPSPLVAELLASPMMQRLKEIDQSGFTRYIDHTPDFSRYDHSLGVYMLLRCYQRPEKECIAGLLHDASHTVFSHVGDLVFDFETDKGSYQDKIHEWYLKEQGIDRILMKYGLTIADILPKKPEFIALEQELPDLCADRIEYNLNTAYLFGLLSKEDVYEILDALYFKEGVWYFDDANAALRFANLSLHFTTNFWASYENLLFYHWAAATLRYCIAQNEITNHEMHFSTDTSVLLKLRQSEDEVVRDLFRKCIWIEKYAVVVHANKQFDIHLKGKFRGVDPFVRVKKKLFRLSELDSDFKSSWQETKRTTEQGFHVKFLEEGNG